MKKKKKRLVSHHIVNRCHGGKKNERNLFLWTSEREVAWHKLFKDLTFRQAAMVLLRADRMKGGKNEKHHNAHDESSAYLLPPFGLSHSEERGNQIRQSL